jgi:hypothetical protein
MRTNSPSLWKLMSNPRMPPITWNMEFWGSENRAIGSPHAWKFGQDMARAERLQDVAE